MGPCPRPTFSAITITNARAANLVFDGHGAPHDGIRTPLFDSRFCPVTARGFDTKRTRGR